MSDIKYVEAIKDLLGVGPSTVKKLADGGYITVMSLASASKKELTAISGIGESAATKMITLAQDVLEFSFETADVFLERRKEMSFITTGSRELDELLGGRGVELRSVTELFGEFRTGKTQLAHQFCVTVQLPVYLGGLRGEGPDSEPIKAVYIDCEGTFRPERIVGMSARYMDEGINIKEILLNILVARAYNSDHQMTLALEAARAAMSSNIKLIVIDSLTSHFRAEYTGRGELASRQQKLNRHIHRLLRTAEVCDLAVVVTNQVSTKPDTFFEDPTVPIGGHIVGHTTHLRLYLRKGKANSRIARVYDSPNLPEREAVFTITEEGIGDMLF
ncbi:MAG: DNA repair and recombination protein RadA [Candidatus Odinarchaeota archaeon]